MAFELLAVGLTTMDVVARSIDDLTRSERAVIIEGVVAAPAGTAGGTALIAARLGVRTGLAGAVGNDMNGQFVRTALADAGVDVTHLEVQAEMPTSSTLLTVESNGRRSAWHAIGAGSFANIGADLHAAAATARFVHYGGVGGVNTNGGPGAALLKTACEAGAVVTCDLVTPRDGAAEEVAALLPYVDYFLPSAAEARALSGQEELHDAAEHFCQLGAKACIIKNGEDGCHGFVNGAHFSVPAFKVDAVDTTSCGDAFCAGFIAGLARGWDVRRSCQLGASAAAQVARGLATLGKLADIETTVAAIATTPVRSA